MAVAIDEQIAKIIIWILYFVGLYFSLFWMMVLLFDKQEQTKRKKPYTPAITIILPMWNEEGSIERTLESVYALNYPKNKLKVICVDNNSTDNTPKILKKLNKKWDFLHLTEKKQGKHNAMNLGLKHTKTPFFACLDADSFVEPDSVKNMMLEFDHPNVAAVMPIMKVSEPENILQRVQWLEYLMNIFYKYIMGQLDCIHVTPGPLSIYRTKIVNKLGNFRKGHLTEDLEMALRLQDNHYKLKQSLDGFVTTIAPKKLKGFVAQRTRWYHGTFLNIKDYKHFLFNRKYEEFGIFHIPMVGLTGILSIVGIITIMYLFIKEMYFTIKRMYMTHFDFWTYINNYDFSFDLLDFDWMTLFTSFVLFFLIFVIIYLSFLGTKERTNIFRNIKYFFMFLYYFFIYKFIMGYIWIKVGLRLLRNHGGSWTKDNDR